MSHRIYLNLLGCKTKVSQGHQHAHRKSEQPTILIPRSGHLSASTLWAKEDILRDPPRELTTAPSGFFIVVPLWAEPTRSVSSQRAHLSMPPWWKLGCRHVFWGEQEHLHRSRRPLSSIILQIILCACLFPGDSGGLLLLDLRALGKDHQNTFGLCVTSLCNQ